MEKDGFEKYYEKEGKNKAGILEKKEQQFLFQKVLWNDIILKQSKKDGKNFGKKIKVLKQTQIKKRKNFIALRCFPTRLARYTWDT